MPQFFDSSPDRVRTAIRQRLESLQRAGLTHLPRRRASSSLPAADQPRPAGKEPASPSVPPAGAAGEPAREEPADSGSLGPLGTAPMPTGLSAEAKAEYVRRCVALNEVAERVKNCPRCPDLVATRTQTVFGTGSPLARLAFLGEAPGADEDRQGIPFVGRAGKLLTDMIERGMKIRREDVYILNIVRCRPPGNRTPLPPEAASCREYLDAQLAIVRPEFLCCLGACAAQSLLGTSSPLGRLRGRVHDYEGIKVVCTYHPAYLLRAPNMKRAAWEDLQLLMREMGLPVPSGPSPK